MADQIQKFLARLSKKEFELVQAALLDIANNELSHLDYKPLRGVKDTFRVRKGSIRIVFYSSSSETRILQISRRDEQTYRGY